MRGEPANRLWLGRSGVNPLGFWFSSCLLEAGHDGWMDLTEKRKKALI